MKRVVSFELKNSLRNCTVLKILQGPLKRRLEVRGPQDPWANEYGFVQHKDRALYISSDGSSKDCGSKGFFLSNVLVNNAT
ncbi:hypothetical protein TNCV_4558821 [Trichonephila clavipes]|uniref:Uncharacterized protein n=1 Tax=Trichonephila clavipes TaxID=2585209 RepID=A0A8X6WFS7_TRICX|nr:hypothetical protein TNCV_4558821 [Trichonephila clavipes]